MTRLPPIGEVKRQASGTGAIAIGAIVLTVSVGFQRTATLTRRTTDRLQDRLDGLLDRLDTDTTAPESATVQETDSHPDSKSDPARDSTSSGPSDDPSHWPTTHAEILEYGSTPEEYVRDVLSRNDGRLRQRRFVDDYGWAASTISRLLSELEERGRIVRYRLGREKVVCLPEAVPSSHRS
ncbi:helix-turn-helix transcriptional regulator [Natronoglomus mannanivorans]|uniref:MarR family transcriptional regulator n=1 Tax=Natronoglomus mannanivorans TaxID=2979990 RepID=A0AAP2Z1Q1_9EURY|nr:MarR family transcriptional regulator [Halobacteria archaeon AArc-xg1-1]